MSQASSASDARDVQSPDRQTCLQHPSTGQVCDRSILPPRARSTPPSKPHESRLTPPVSINTRYEDRPPFIPAWGDVISLSQMSRAVPPSAILKRDNQPVDSTLDTLERQATAPHRQTHSRPRPNPRSGTLPTVHFQAVHPPLEQLSPPIRTGTLYFDATEQLLDEIANLKESSWTASTPIERLVNQMDAHLDVAMPDTSLPANTSVSETAVPSTARGLDTRRQVVLTSAGISTDLRASDACFSEDPQSKSVAAAPQTVSGECIRPLSAKSSALTDMSIPISPDDVDLPSEITLRRPSEPLGSGFMAALRRRSRAYSGSSLVGCAFSASPAKTEVSKLEVLWEREQSRAARVWGCDGASEGPLKLPLKDRIKIALIAHGIRKEEHHVTHRLVAAVRKEWREMTHAFRRREGHADKGLGHDGTSEGMPRSKDHRGLRYIVGRMEREERQVTKKMFERGRREWKRLRSRGKQARARLERPLTRRKSSSRDLWRA